MLTPSRRAQMFFSWSGGKDSALAKARLSHTQAPKRSLLSIQLSIDPDIIRHREGSITADHAIRQRFTDFLPDFLLPFGRLISVRSVIQSYAGLRSGKRVAAMIDGASNLTRVGVVG